MLKNSEIIKSRLHTAAEVNIVHTILHPAASGIYNRPPNVIYTDIYIKKNITAYKNYILYI